MWNFCERVQVVFLKAQENIKCMSSVLELLVSRSYHCLADLIGGDLAWYETKEWLAVSSFLGNRTRASLVRREVCEVRVLFSFGHVSEWDGGDGQVQSQLRKCADLRSV